MKISLIGPMAAGKSTVGHDLAQKLALPLYDTDTEIEKKMHATVSQIFAERGEATFRQLESDVLLELLSKQEDCIIATGGGIIKAASNRTFLKTQTLVFFLDVSISEQLKRTEGDHTRPILNGVNREDKLTHLRSERWTLYQETAHHILIVDQLNPEALALQIQNKML
ncbi:MAG: shikimate kinase [Gammaproteobacteria bacterium]|jgi:shikimate kinase|nr:shikimate kinase [Gammaproteobacteria bacterium]